MVGTLVPMPVDLRQGANVDTVPITLRLTIVVTTIDNDTTVNGTSILLVWAVIFAFLMHRFVGKDVR